MRALVAIALALAQAAAFAQALTPARGGPLAPAPSAPVVSFTQHLGVELPLGAPFTDSAGHAIRLADEIPRGAGPTLLMLGYHRCPQLCGLATQGVLEALRRSGLPASAARILFVSVDPAETAGDAADKRRADLGYARLLAGAGAVAAPTIERLVGPAASIAALARSVGFVYQRGDAAARFAHPEGVVVITPDGRVSRYLMGVRFDPIELREALQAARDGQVGQLSDRLALLCAHLDPRAGLHSEAVLVGMRVAGIGGLALLAAFLWRRREDRLMAADTDAALSSGWHLLGAAASTQAGRTDAIFLAMLLLCGTVAVVLLVLVAFFSIRYRRGTRVDRTPPRELRGIEIAWTVTPLLIFFGIFGWAARDYITMADPPADALPVSLVAKQWMWKLQHRNGRREINELHVPQGEPVVVTMTSQDVIHSFFIPAFRIKQDVLPGRYTRLWFTANRLGEFPLFCSEYCGSEHSLMTGRVVVMTQADYGRWLASGPAQPSMAQYGFALFRQLGCSGCHDPRSTIHAPLLDGVYGRTVHLQDGRTVVADANYLRDSILVPAKDIVAGFAPVMPSFAGQVSEEDIQALIAYLQSTSKRDAP